MTLKNNRGLIITIIILLVMVILLLTGLMAFVISSDGSGNFVFSNNTIFDESYDSSACDKLTVNTSGGDITIKQSDDNQIRITARGGNQNSFNVSNDDGTISIQYFVPKKINLFGKNIHNMFPNIDIYVPENAIDTFEIDSNIGDITIENQLNANLKVSCDIGDIKADTLCGAFDIHTDCGDIDIKNININKNSSASTDLGDIEIEHTNNIRIDYKTSLGNCDIKNNNIESDIILKVETSLGEIEIN